MRTFFASGVCPNINKMKCLKKLVVYFTWGGDGAVDLKVGNFYPSKCTGVVLLLCIGNYPVEHFLIPN